MLPSFGFLEVVVMRMGREDVCLCLHSISWNVIRQQICDSLTVVPDRKDRATSNPRLHQEDSPDGTDEVGYAAVCVVLRPMTDSVLLG